MGIISWIILGAIAGFVGSKIVNKTGQGLIMDIALGIVGAIVGGLISSQLFGVGVTGLNIWSLIVAIAGSVVVLWAYHQISGKRAL
ncbi:GlsB/YeaQ/YmgE family stress response membrane protein [Mesorhizobium sp. 128a]